MSCFIRVRKVYFIDSESLAIHLIVLSDVFADRGNSMTIINEVVQNLDA